MVPGSAVQYLERPQLICSYWPQQVISSNRSLITDLTYPHDLQGNIFSIFSTEIFFRFFTKVNDCVQSQLRCTYDFCSELEFSGVSSEVGGVSLGLSWCTVMVQCTLYSDGTLYSDDTPCTTAMRLAPLCRQSVRVLWADKQIFMKIKNIYLWK